MKKRRHDCTHSYTMHLSATSFWPFKRLIHSIFTFLTITFLLRDLYNNGKNWNIFSTLMCSLRYCRWYIYKQYMDSLMAQMIKNLPAMQKTWVWPLGGENPLEKGMATHPSSVVFAWTIGSTPCLSTFFFSRNLDFCPHLIPLEYVVSCISYFQWLIFYWLSNKLTYNMKIHV